MQIKRDIYNRLKNHLGHKEITIITGPRQAGKTTLMKELQSGLTSEGEKTVYLNLDIETDFKICASQQALLGYIALEIGEKAKGYIFIDEIQVRSNAGSFLKGLYDMGLDLKFIISGSGSVELKEKVLEGLAGRSKLFSLPTLSFSEYLNFQLDYKYDQNLAQYLKTLGDDSYLNNYLYLGGYPKVVLSKVATEKSDVLESIFSSYVDKDLRQLLDVRNTSAVLTLLTFLSVRIGKLVNYSEMSNSIDLSFETLKQYLYYMEKTFIVSSIKPYFTNPESELTKNPIYYFNDLGMRNYIYNRLSYYDPIISGSMLFQNLVFLLLNNQNAKTKMNYWRTKDKAEVDFIVSVGSIITPVEVKYSDLDSTTVSRSFTHFINKYSPKTAIVVNKSFYGQREMGSTKILFIPYFELMNQDFLATV